MVVESVVGRGVACNVHQLIGIIWFEFFSVYQSMLLKRYLGGTIIHINYVGIPRIIQFYLSVRRVKLSNIWFIWSPRLLCKPLLLEFVRSSLTRRSSRRRRRLCVLLSCVVEVPVFPGILTRLIRSRWREMVPSKPVCIINLARQTRYIRKYK